MCPPARPRTWLGLACALALASAGIVGCGGDGDESTVPPEVAATVNTRTIPESEVDGYMRAQAVPPGADARRYGPPRFEACVAARRTAVPEEDGREARKQCKLEYEIQRAQAVSFLVRAQWLEREGERRGIDVRRALARAARQASPSTRLGVRVALLTERLQQLTPVTDAEIQRYGRANAQVYHGAERRTAHVLQTTSRRQLLRARRELERGASWASVQERYGIKPFDRHWSGTKTVSARNRPEDDFGDRLFEAEPGRLSRPLRTLNGWFLFELIRVQQPRYPGLSPRARAHVETTLRGKKLEAQLQRRYAADTRCAPRYRVPESPQCVRSAGRS